MHTSGVYAAKLPDSASCSAPATKLKRMSALAEVVKVLLPALDDESWKEIWIDHEQNTKTKHGAKDQ
jgi:hypothetical protein